jgi:hypothetical protein
MQSLRCLFPSVRAVVIALLGMAACPLVSLAQTAPGVTEQDITGVIIATQEDRVSIGAGDTVILDQGRARGIEVGDRYVIFQRHSTVVHPVTGRLIRVPPEPIGELAVVHVHEQTSLALLLRSTREVNVGASVAPLRVTLTPRQESHFVRPRDSTPEEAATALQRARQHGAWRLGDGR